MSTSAGCGTGRCRASEIRAALPGLIVCWAIYGDSYGTDPSRVWGECARAAEGCGVACLMIDAEFIRKTAARGATLADRNALAHRGVTAMRLAAPLLCIVHTSYDGPVSIVRDDGQGRWGGHQSYPWKGFLGGARLVQASAYRVYIGGGKTEGTLEGAKNRQARHAKSLRAGVRMKLISPEVEPWQYLQFMDQARERSATSQSSDGSHVVGRPRHGSVQVRWRGCRWLWCSHASD